jgi:hypothetical protein
MHDGLTELELTKPKTLNPTILLESTLQLKDIKMMQINLFFRTNLSQKVSCDFFLQN